MATTPTSPSSLPQNPSEEYLRKHAKRIARADTIQLAAVQRRLAHEYGYRNWAELMTAVQAMASRSVGDSGANSPAAPGSPPSRESARNIFPLLPLRGLVAFPHVSYPIFVGRPMSIMAVAHAKTKHSYSPISQKNTLISELTNSTYIKTYKIAVIVETLHLPDRTLKIVVESRRRAHCTHLILHEEFFKTEAEEIEEAAISKLNRSVLSAFLRERVRTVSEGVNKPEAFGVSATTADGASVLADRIASELRMELASKQALLELLNPLERLEKLLAYLNALS